MCDSFKYLNSSHASRKVTLWNGRIDEDRTRPFPNMESGTCEARNIFREEACKWRVCIRYLQNFVKGEKRKKKNKKERRKEEERQGGTELISVFFCWAVSWTRPLEQGEEGKDSWREGETRRRGKRASSLRMSLLSPWLVHNLLLQSRVESRRRIFSGAPFLSFGFSQSTTTSNPRKRRATNPREKVHSNFFFIINQKRTNFLTVREAFVVSFRPERRYRNIHATLKIVIVRVFFPFFWYLNE